GFGLQPTAPMRSHGVTALSESEKEFAMDETAAKLNALGFTDAHALALNELLPDLEQRNQAIRFATSRLTVDRADPMYGALCGLCVTEMAHQLHVARPDA